MRHFSTFLIERLKINKDIKIQEYKYFPKDFNELFSIICNKVEEIKKNNGSILNLNDIDTSKIEIFINLFTKLNFRYDMDSFIEEIKLDRWDVSNALSFHAMFNGCEGLKRIDISNWNVSNVNNMTAMFNNCFSLESIGNLSNWNTENLNDAELMFSECKHLKDIGNLDNWYVENLEKMDLMFSGCIKLKNIGDISGWNLIKIENMIYMFEKCKSLANVGDLNKWQPHIDNLIKREGRGALNGFSRGAKFKKPEWDNR